ncbi:MAG TPA: hypothetical protein VHA06_17960 [Candidatus Angelobacter sp.]|jgi:hypothetical protein|nr:hypothetical protein [Candidatus Angelobacter sp.]
MLILSDRRLLGDGPNGENLRNEESLARLQEKTKKDLQRYRWPDQAEMTDFARRVGQRMSHSDLIRRVKSLNPAIFVEQSINYPDCLSLYHVDAISGKKTYLSYMDKGDMPEFSALMVDEKDIPEQEIRGWRTILVRLLSLHALQWRDVENEFDDPISDLNANRWYAETKPFRT